MAELYLAKDTKKDRLVVIKRILPYLAQEREFVQMFLDEARIASQLHHPNIITVYELGHLEGSIFIAMEYVEGVDLRKIFNEEQKRQGTVPPNITAWLTSKLCDGLHYAHNRTGADGKPLQIIHRDVSPQNLMIGYQGQVKLVDFGIAKAGAIMERSKPGVIKGKFLYLSPEQLSQERIDHRADIFALGTMMYELTVGKSPFYKATTEAVIYAIRAEEPPPPHLTRRDFPMGLSRIIMRCLQKDRSKRYQQAGEVHADLEAWMRTEARTTVEDVKHYVARLFGSDEERTSLFIPANARGPNDRVTDRRQKVVSQPGIGKLPPTDPERTFKGNTPAPQPINEETTKPLVPPLTEGSSAGSIVTTNSVITAPIGRRPTPQPMKAVSGPRPAVPPPQRISNPAAPAYSGNDVEPRTQTARPQDLAKAFVAPPARKPSGEALMAAGGAEDEDATALNDSGSSRAITGDSLSSLTPSMPQASVRTPSTVESRPPVARQPSQSGAKAPESLRATRQPIEPAPTTPARKPTRAENGAVGRAPTAALPQVAARAPTGTVQQAQAPRAATGTVQQQGRAATGAVQQVQARASTGTVQQQGRRSTRAETGAVFDVPQAYARDEIRSVPPPPTLPPEPSTKEDRPNRGKTPSVEDIGPLLDEAIPSGLGKVVPGPAATFDQDDNENTMDFRGSDLSRLGESQDASAEVPSQSLPAPAAEDDEGAVSIFAERPWLVAGLVFVVVLVLGLGGLAIYRSRQKAASGPQPPKVTETTKPPEPPKTDGAPPGPSANTAKPPEPTTPPPSTEVDAPDTVVVKIVAPAGTKLVDQRDASALSPNTPYRWHPGRRPIQYRCPKKGRLQQPDVMYNVEVKPGIAEQTFTISCK